MQLLKRISTRSVFGSKEDIQRLVLSNEKINHPLYRVYGYATGYVTGASKFKNADGTDQPDWVCIAGDFEAINTNGEVFNAALCFLPNYITGPIVQALKENSDISQIEIAYDIVAQYDKQSATSYTYLAQSVRRAGEVSQLESLREKIEGAPMIGRSEAPKQLEGKGKGK